MVAQLSTGFAVIIDFTRAQQSIGRGSPPTHGQEVAVTMGCVPW